MSEDLISNNYEKEHLKKIINKNILLVKLVLIIGGLIQCFYSISSIFQIINPIPDPTTYEKIEPYLLLAFIFLYFYSWLSYLKGQRLMKDYINNFEIEILKKANLYFGKALITTLLANLLTIINIIIKTPWA